MINREYYFDVQHGGLIIGAAAVEQAFESSQGIDLPVGLSDMLHAKVPEYKNGDYVHYPVDDCDDTDYRMYGKWLAALTSEDDHMTTSDKTIHRAYHLGIGPSRDRIVARFGSVWQYRQSLGLEIGRTNYRFADWGRIDYVTYAQSLAQELGRRPTRNDYHAKSIGHGGPPVNALYNVFGSIGELNELIGYPDVKKWDIADYIQWGADVKHANDYAELTQTLVAMLSKNDRGPSFRTLYNKFGSLIRYQGLVDIELQNRQEQKLRKIKHYHKLIADNQLPLAYRSLKEADLLHMAGKYVLVNALIRKHNHVADSRTITAIADADTNDMIRLLLARRGVSRADIEVTAVEMAIFDDIWPAYTEARFDYLRVIEE